MTTLNTFSVFGSIKTTTISAVNVIGVAATATNRIIESVDEGAKVLHLKAEDWRKTVESEIAARSVKMSMERVAILTQEFNAIYENATKNLDKLDKKLQEIQLKILGKQLQRFLDALAKIEA